MLLKDALGLLIPLALAVTLAGVWTVQADDPEEDPVFSEFASGERFYLVPDSITPIGNGRLRYEVRGEPGVNNAPGSRLMSESTFDCKTGQMRSYHQGWRVDAKGNISDRQTYLPNAITLRNNSNIYQPLKDACSEHEPKIKQGW